MENEVVDLVRKIVDVYMKSGPSKALKLSRKAVVDHAGFPLLHRLHAMYIFEKDRSDILSAVKSAKMAVFLYPRSLEYRFFHISLLYNNADGTVAIDAPEKLWVVWECEEALRVDGPLEPYWELYMVDEKAIKSGEEAVEFLKIGLWNMINLCHREIDTLPENFLDDIVLSSYSNSYEKMKVTGNMINGDYHSCAFVERMHSEFCFQSAMGVDVGEERKRFLLDQAFYSAKIAHRVFNASMDYLINLYTRTLQCSDHLSLIHLRMVKYKLTKALDFDYRKEPYYKYLIKDTITDLRELPEYYKNCIRLLLTFIRTLEERRAINDHTEEFISIYYKYLDESNLRNFAEQSIFFRENIIFLLDNVPNLKMMIDEDLQTRDGKETSELRDIVDEIVDTYKKEGPSEARQLTHDALQIYESSSILLRLQAKYTFDNDRSEIESALKFAKTAVHSCPQSLEHRFFHASLLYNKAATANTKDNMLYWEIVLECDEALDLERSVEPLWVLHMVDKKTEGIKSEEEAAEYVKTCLHNLINMCYRMIDALPKNFLDGITSSKHDTDDKLLSTNIILNTNRFCAFVYRMHSEFCFEFALEYYWDNIGMRTKWLILAYISARAAHHSFKRSVDYAVNMCARMLQCLNFSRSQLQLMKEKLENCLRATNNHEPYYKYLVHSDLTNHAEQRDYFKNCIGLLQAFIRTMEQVDQINVENEDCEEGSARNLTCTENNYKIYYEFLDEYNLRDFTEQSKFFNTNIKFLLENPPQVIDKLNEVLDKSEDAKNESSEEKKRKKKKKKIKRKAKGLEVDLDDKDDAVNACDDAKQEDLPQDMNAKLIIQ